MEQQQTRKQTQTEVFTSYIANMCLHGLLPKITSNKLSSTIEFYLTEDADESKIKEAVSAKQQTDGDGRVFYSLSLPSHCEDHTLTKLDVQTLSGMVQQPEQALPSDILQYINEKGMDQQQMATYIQRLRFCVEECRRHTKQQIEKHWTQVPAGQKQKMELPARGNILGVNIKNIEESDEVSVKFNVLTDPMLPDINQTIEICVYPETATLTGQKPEWIEVDNGYVIGVYENNTEQKRQSFIDENVKKQRASADEFDLQNAEKREGIFNAG